MVPAPWFLPLLLLVEVVEVVVHYCLQRELILLVRLILLRCQISVIKLANCSFAMDAVPHQAVGRLEEVVSRLC